MVHLWSEIKRLEKADRLVSFISLWLSQGLQDVCRPNLSFYLKVWWHGHCFRLMVKVNLCVYLTPNCVTPPFRQHNQKGQTDFTVHCWLWSFRDGLASSVIVLAKMIVAYLPRFKGLYLFGLWMHQGHKHWCPLGKEQNSNRDVWCSSDRINVTHDSVHYFV